MTPETAVLPTGKVNRFKVFHHERKQRPWFYHSFEWAVTQVLMRKDTPHVVPARVLRDTLTRDYPWVKWQVDGIDVFKAMLSWYRYQNPKTADRWRYRKTERSRRRTTGIDWAQKSRESVPFATLNKLAMTLRQGGVPTTMTLLKRDAGVKFNQNFNAEVTKSICEYYPSLAPLLSRVRRLVR